MLRKKQRCWTSLPREAIKMVQTKKIKDTIPLALKTVNIKNLGKKYSGKVRDFYILDDKRIIITTDRLSAFDRVLGQFPYKGQALNQLSEFWFNKTSNVIQNHKISVPDPNVMVVKNCTLIPIEMVVRGYITGVTNTSIWGSYEVGERVIYGLKFPDGLRKNQKLPTPVITPTTKADEGHDERLTEKDILEGKVKLREGTKVTPALWKKMKQAALDIFERGSKVCARAGIILVDTKYEFGLDEKGKLILIDEVHTPDSSRFWVKNSYQERFKKGKEPKNFDKEFLRIWYAKQGYKGDGKPPKLTPEIISQVSKRYIDIYEKITGKKFKAYPYPIEKRIFDNIAEFRYD